MTDARSYYAWHRRGLASFLVGDAAVGSARASLPAALSLDAAHRADIPVDVLGPGDVAGLAADEVARTEPVDACLDFDPSNFPYIELRHADLPWRFNPGGPKTVTVAGVTQRRLIPWLALVVVDADQAKLDANASTALLHCDAALLPAHDELWAWAHVQTDGSADGNPDTLSDPNTAFARIVCPIRLEGGRRYRACLVPTFAAGVAAAGVAVKPATDPLGPAWGSSGDTTLPVYFSWTFGTTGAGSFETLARRLRPRSAPAASAGRMLRIDAPGWGATAAQGATVTVQGALRPVSDIADLPADPAFAISLAAAVSSSGAGLQLRPPLYGQDFASGSTAVSAVDVGWFTDVNTDARRRLAAGLAAWAVAVEQEDLCDMAWKQLADFRRDNPDVNVGNTAADIQAVIQAAIEDRHGATDGGLPAAAVRQLRPGGPLGRHGFATAASLLTSPNVPTGLAPMPASAAGTFSPTITTPAFNLLRAVAPDWVLPGIADLPDNSIVLAETNPAFMEAFLIGANHALARELQWRRYPLNRDTTLFATFWPDNFDEKAADIDPLSTWTPEGRLGSHLKRNDQIVLAIRGPLLQRFPTTIIYLSGQLPGKEEQVVKPVMATSLDANTTLVAFPLTDAELIHPTAPGQVWSIVLQESVKHPRFGLDDAPPGGTTATLTTWQDLDWGNPQQRDHGHVVLSGTLNGQTWPTGATTPLGTPPKVTWSTDSGAMAAILTRAPVRVRIPAALWLTAGGN